MNDALGRVLRTWADSRWYWIPLTGLRPAPAEPLGWGTVTIHALSGALWPGVLVSVGARLLWPGRWSPEAFLLPALAGGVASLCWSAMIRSAWNRRTTELRRRQAAGEAAPVAERAGRAERWLLQPAVFLACLALGIALVTAVENVRGSLALQKLDAELRARNQPVTLADIVPPPVSDERNFAMAPLLEPMLDYERPGPRDGQTMPSIRWRDTNAYARSQKMLKFEGDRTSFSSFASEQARAGEGRTAGTRGGKQPRHALAWTEGVPVDLELWRQYYRSMDDWPKSETPGTAAADVLLALSRNDPELNELRAAAAERPESRFPLHYEESFAMLLPPLAVMKRGAGLLRLRAVALLAENRVDEALADVRLGFRLGDSIRDEPILISVLVRIAIDQLNLQAVWEGCRDRRWKEPHLASLHAVLAGGDPLGDIRRALAGERILSGVAYEIMAREPERLEGYWDPEGSGGSGGDEGLRWYLRLTPRGWVRQNQVAHFRYGQALIDDLAAAPFHAALRPGDARFAEFLPKNSPYTVLASMIAPALDNVSVKGFEAEGRRRLALVGIALERHRLAAGSYPETLAALAPRFLPSVPDDPWDGKPLRYSRQPDGDFRLYAVGRDHVDDGGMQPTRRARSSMDPRASSDQVWR